MRLKRWCGVPGCGHVHAYGGLCSKHAQRKKAREKAGVFHAALCACASCMAERRHEAMSKQRSA